MKRARAPEQKTARKAHILAVATECFLANPAQLPSVAGVATSAGIAKGTVYLYFQTKEEIFLEVFIEQLRQLLGSVIRDGIDSTAEFSQQLARHLLHFHHRQPAFLPLASRLHTILEQNLSTTRLMQFKETLCLLLSETGHTIDSRFHYPKGFSERGLIQSYAALTGLWQMLQWPQALESVKDHSAFRPLQRDFHAELQGLLALIWNDQTEKNPR